MARGGTIDAHRVEELDLWIDNTEPLYNQKRAIERNLVRHKKRGTYNHAKAPKAFSYVVEAAAKDYHKNFDAGGPWHRAFSTATRRQAAREMADDFEERYEAGFLGKASGLKGSPGWLLVGLLTAATFALTVMVRNRQRREGLLPPRA